jgi:hypothetical protein
MAESHQNIMKQFFGLANRLSPENLHCDGEISKAQVQMRYRQIMREWATLERKVGRKVSLEEVEIEQFKKWRSGMDNSKLAKELLFLAKEVLGMDFPTQDAFDKYMKEHPDANRSNHKVVKTDKKDSPAKKYETKKSDELKAPDSIGGKPTNEKAWGACVEMAKAQKAWGQKTVKDKKWMDEASETSRQMAREYADKPIREMAEYSYSYHQMRHEMGVKSTHPGAFGADIEKWKQMTENGTHPDLKAFKK